MHNGFVNVNHEKMSKSLGNFFTIRDVLKKYDAEALRFFLLGTHYRSPIDFSDQQLEDATRTLDRLYRLLEEAGALAAAAADGPRDAEAAAAVAGLDERFREAMDDDFNTAGAIGEVFKAARAVSGALARGGGLDRATLAGFVGAVRRIGDGPRPLQQRAGGLVRPPARARAGRPRGRCRRRPGSRARSPSARPPARRGTSRPPTGSARELLERGVTLEDTPGGRRGG